jgi:hypothetical protein
MLRSAFTPNRTTCRRVQDDNKPTPSRASEPSHGCRGRSPRWRSMAVAWLWRGVIRLIEG